MKMIARRVSRALSVCAAAALAVSMAEAPAAQSPAGDAAQAPTAQGQRRAGPGQMDTMMAERKAMQAEMAAQQKKLDELVAAMNVATGAEKVDRIAAVLTELVAQHQAMRGRMGGMMMQMQEQPSVAPPAAQPPAAQPPAGHEQHH